MLHSIHQHTVASEQSSDYDSMRSLIVQFKPHTRPVYPCAQRQLADANGRAFNIVCCRTPANSPPRNLNALVPTCSFPVLAAETPANDVFWKINVLWTPADHIGFPNPDVDGTSSIG